MIIDRIDFSVHNCIISIQMHSMHKRHNAGSRTESCKTPDDTLSRVE